MVVFDAGILISLLTPRTTERHKKERLEFLVRNLHQTRTKILIPTPALSELLVHAPELADGFSRSSGFEVVPFDQRAAIECSISIRRRCLRETRKENKNAAWSKVKIRSPNRSHCA